MKKLILIISMFFSINAWAQYESVFGETSTSWNFLIDLLGARLTDSLHVTGDTVINSVEYKAIKRSFNGYNWFLRETPDKSKVYFLSPIENENELLVMDLNLQVSDTFFIYRGNVKYDTTIVESVFVSEGRKHIRFNHYFEELEYDYPFEEMEYFEFIEGVGTNIGLFYQRAFSLIDPHYLLCSYKDGTRTYANRYYNGQCFFEWSTGIDIYSENNNESNKSISLFPNPSVDRLNILLGGKEYSDKNYLQIFNIYGRLVTSLMTSSDHVELTHKVKNIYQLFHNNHLVPYDRFTYETPMIAATYKLNSRGFIKP